MNKSKIAVLPAAAVVVWLPPFGAIAGRDVSLELAQATSTANGEVRRIDK